MIYSIIFVVGFVIGWAECYFLHRRITKIYEETLKEIDEIKRVNDEHSLHM